MGRKSTNAVIESAGGRPLKGDQGRQHAASLSSWFLPQSAEALWPALVSAGWYCLSATAIAGLGSNSGAAGQLEMKPGAVARASSDSVPQVPLFRVGTIELASLAPDQQAPTPDAGPRSDVQESVPKKGEPLLPPGQPADAPKEGTGELFPPTVILPQNEPATGTGGSGSSSGRGRSPAKEKAAGVQSPAVDESSLEVPSPKVDPTEAAFQSLSRRMPSPETLLSTDSTSRALAVRAVTPAESLLDGLGGFPSPDGSGFTSFGAPSGGKNFRLGPMTFRPTANAGVGFGTTSEAQSKGSGSSGNTNNQGGPDGFTAHAGLAFPFVIGEPATGHFLSGTYAMDLHTLDNTGGSNGTDESPFDQQLSLAGTLEFAKVTLGLAVSFASLSGQNRDVGGATDRDLLAIALTSSFQISPKLSLEWDNSVPIREVSGGIGTRAFNSSVMLNYQFDPKLEVGLGIGGGYEKTDTSSDTSLVRNNDFVEGQNASQAARSETYESINGRIGFLYSPKLSFFFTPGVEFREQSRDIAVNPIFGLGVSWAPRVGTSVSLAGNQRVQSSISLAGQDFVSTTFSLSATQRLGNRLSLLATVAYEHADYSQAGNGQTNDGFASSGGTDVTGEKRVDNLFTVLLGLSVALSPRWSATLSYSFSDNESNLPDFAFTSNRIQLQTSFAF